MSAALSWSDFASFSVAGGTLALAWLTRRAVMEARRASDAAREEGQATLGIATETHRDRELAWRPVLTWEVTDLATASGGEPEQAGVTVVVKNVGNGPAIGCEYVARDRGRCTYHRGFALSAGEVVELSIGASKPPWQQEPQGLFDPATSTRLTGRRPRRMQMLMCSDILGRRWRFFEDFPPESVNSDDLDPPAWALPPDAVVGDPQHDVIASIHGDARPGGPGVTAAVGRHLAPGAGLGDRGFERVERIGEGPTSPPARSAATSGTAPPRVAMPLRG